MRTYFVTRYEVMKHIQQEAIKDVRSVKGSNYRKIMILAGGKMHESMQEAVLKTPEQGCPFRFPYGCSGTRAIGT